ncbi:MAG TPA: hypothetical protein VGE93_11660 [Bryobacteraceae bacterium]
MKKLLLSIAVLCTTAIVSKAQMAAGDFHFGAGIHLGLPIGDFHNVSSFGIGGELQGEYAFTENVTGVATTGYTYFAGKSIDLGGGDSYKANYGHIPVLVGARYYATEQVFFGAQIGYGHYSVSISSNVQGFTGASGGSGGFEYRPQVGYNANPVQFILSYDGTSVSGGTFSQIGLYAIYTFGGGK